MWRPLPPSNFSPLVFWVLAGDFWQIWSHTGPRFVYFVGLEFLACAGSMGGDADTVITGVLQVVLQDPCPALCCWSLCNSALGKSFLVMHFSCNVFLCPQEKQDHVRRAVMKLIRSCLSSSFWLRRSGRDARYLSCFAAGMQCLSALALCSFGRLIQVHESV